MTEKINTLFIVDAKVTFTLWLWNKQFNFIYMLLLMLSHSIFLSLHLLKNSFSHKETQ